MISWLKHILFGIDRRSRHRDYETKTARLNSEVKEKTENLLTIIDELSELSKRRPKNGRLHN